MRTQFSKITLAIGVLCLFAFAQTKPKAAVYIKGNPEGRDALRMAVNTFLIKSQKYQMIAVDAIDLVAQEQNRQMGGSVSNEDIAQLGRDAGAQYVCVVERSESDGISYVSTSMVSVQSKIAELSEMSELPRGGRIIDLIEWQINSMIGINTPKPVPVVQEPVPTYAPVYTPEYEYTPPKKAKAPPTESSYSENSNSEPQDASKMRVPRLRLGIRGRTGFFWQNSNAGSKLFDKSYAEYEEMKEMLDWNKHLGGWYAVPGLMLNLRLIGPIGVASEFNYSFVSYDILYGGEGTGLTKNFAKVSISYQTIEVPILLRLWSQEDNGVTYYEAGYQFGFPVNSEATVSSGTEFEGTPFKDKFSDFRVKRDESIVVGVGAFFSNNFSVGLRFTYPLKKLDKYGTINASSILSVMNMEYSLF
ncbi:MAG: PorT family protein [Fibromonadaceae bacterium]|jgi:hypothetical protein|nr:PorT family protein [Fibromonadaceae bacterium]